MMRRPTSRAWLHVAMAIGLAAPAAADSVPRSTLGWAVNGIVSEVARAGDVAYVGGSFGTVAPSANLVYGFAAFAVDSAVPVLPRLDVNGRVRAVAALSGGGWIIGGEFTQINGEPRSRLARLLADGTLGPAFSASPNGTVWTLAVSGTRVFVGGSFAMVGATARQRLAAFDVASGALDATFAPVVSGPGSPSVRALVTDGTSVLLGGTFGTLNGSPRANLGRVDATSGATVVSFIGEANGRVDALVQGSAAFHAAGTFSTIGGLSRRGVARLDAGTGAADAGFDANGNGDVSSLALSGTRLFAAGAFGQMGGQTREHLAELDAVTGVAAAWNPGADGNVLRIALAGNALVVAGDFTEIAGIERLHLAALDITRTTDVALPWNPSLNSDADMLYVDPTGGVFAGGGFNFFGAVRRENLAAINLLTGDLLPWNPGANGWIRALDVLGNTVYIGGDFTTIGGVSRDHLAALDGVTGVVASWTANPNARVNGLMIASDAVYFVGEFSQIKNSTSRGRGAAVSVDGTVLPWNPVAAGGGVESLFVAGDLVYLGGEFTTLGGLDRENLGAVDAASGAPSTTFAPSVNGSIYRVDVHQGLVFFGGDFAMVNGSTRHNAAAVKAAPGTADDGQLQGWNPDVGGPIYDIDAFGDDVYLAGGFGSVGGSSRPGIAMVDGLPNGGALRDWEPEDVNGGAVSVIDTSDTAVLFGGALRNLDNIDIGAVLYPALGLQGVPPPPTTPRIIVRGGVLSLTWAEPPLGARPSAYVVEGGSGPGGRDLANFSTGSTATSFSATGLGAGTYYVRMRALNSFGTSSAGAEQAFVVGAAGCSGPPLPPLDLRASVAGSTVTLAWRASPQSIASGYRLQVGSTSGGGNIGAFDVGAATTFSTAAPTGAYFVRAFATSPCGLSAASTEIAVVVGAPVVPPGPAFGLEGSATGTTVSLAWGPPSVGTSPFQYRLEAGSAPGLANLANLVTPGSTFATAGVPPGLYYVRVRAIGAGGTGPASNEIVVRVQ